MNNITTNVTVNVEGVFQRGHLWLHHYPYSQEFSAGLSSLGIEYDINKNPGLWDTHWCVSLRSIDGLDTTELAAASGFSLPNWKKHLGRI